MADTNHLHAEPVEGDGVNYGGIVWFVVILVGTVVFCQLFVWGLFVFTESRVVKSDVARAPLAAAPAKPTVAPNGRLMTGLESEPSPGLMVDEPTVLRDYRHQQDTALTTYGWVNQGTGVVRLPINRAKDLVMEHGLPVRPVVAPAESATAPAPTTPAAR